MNSPRSFTVSGWLRATSRRRRKRHGNAVREFDALVNEVRRENPRLGLSEAICLAGQRNPALAIERNQQVASRAMHSVVRLAGR